MSTSHSLQYIYLQYTTDYNVQFPNFSSIPFCCDVVFCPVLLARGLLNSFSPWFHRSFFAPLVSIPWPNRTSCLFWIISVIVTVTIHLFRFWTFPIRSLLGTVHSLRVFTATDIIFLLSSFIIRHVSYAYCTMTFAIAVQIVHLCLFIISS